MRSYQRERSPSYVASRRAYSSSVSSRQGPIPGGASQSFVAFVGLYVMSPSSRSDRDPLRSEDHLHQQVQADPRLPRVVELDERRVGAANDDRPGAVPVQRQVVAEGIQPFRQEGRGDRGSLVQIRVPRKELRRDGVDLLARAAREG